MPEDGTLLGRDPNLFIAGSSRLRAEAALSDLYLAGLLHDIGKLGLPDQILQKNNPLTDAEFARVKEHPVIGERLLTSIDSLSHIRPVVRHHHERYDGLGYPDQLKGNQIPLLARIMAVVDSFDAMNSDRPYRKAFAREHIDQCMLDGSAKAWDPQAIWVFLGCREELLGERERPSHGVWIAVARHRFAFAFSLLDVVSCHSKKRKCKVV